MSDDMDELKRRAQSVRDAYLILKERQRAAGEKVEKLEAEMAGIAKEMHTRSEAISFIEDVAANERVAVKERVERLVTDCLHEVYDDSYSVEFDYGMRGGKTAVEISMVRKCDDGLVVKRQIDGIGGGVSDMMAFPLKLVVLLNDGEYDSVLITDEPGKHLDTTRVRKFAEFVRTVSHELGVQIIMSSHWDIMKDVADTVHEVSLDDSVSRVRRLK